MDLPPVAVVPIRARVRADEGGAVVYARKARVEVGAPHTFDEEHPRATAVELVLGAIAADLVAGVRAAGRRQRVPIDDVEAVVEGALDNPLTVLGVVGEEGHPGLARVAVKVYVDTDEDDEALQGVIDEALERSPLAHTFRPHVPLTIEWKRP